VGINVLNKIKVCMDGGLPLPSAICDKIGFADGHLIRGATDSAGKLGHMTIGPDGPIYRCGKRGCLKALASGLSIARKMKKELKDRKTSIMLDMGNGDRDKLSSKVLLNAVKARDTLALRFPRETSDYMDKEFGLISPRN
jgi:predicted NBD/HSP70 family sugar kinase